MRKFTENIYELRVKPPTDKELQTWNLTRIQKGRCPVCGGHIYTVGYLFLYFMVVCHTCAPQMEKLARKLIDRRRLCKECKGTWTQKGNIKLCVKCWDKIKDNGEMYADAYKIKGMMERSA